MKKPFFLWPYKEVKSNEQMRIVGPILAVMLLLSACANAHDEEMAVPSLDASVEMSPEIENDDSNEDAVRQSIVAVNGIEYDLISADRQWYEKRF